MEKKKVVVTGGAGFLGSHVVPLLLEKDNDVVVLDNFSNGRMRHLEPVVDNPALKIIRGDVTNKEDVKRAFDGCQFVIHLSVLCLRQSLKEPRRVNEVVVDGTLNCLKAALDNNVELFVNVSSAEVYGDVALFPVTEECPYKPTNPYAAAKAAQDMYVRSYGRTYGLPWTTIRPFNMYGPNSHWQNHRGELIPKMIVRAMNRRPLVIFGNGDQTRDFNYVKDVARTLITAAENPDCRNECINVCTGVESSARQIADLICQHWDLDPGEFIKNYPPRPGDISRMFGDNSKLKKLTGANSELSLREGLSRTIEWFESLPFTPEELISEEELKGWE